MGAAESLVPDGSGRRHVVPRDAELVPHRPEDLALSSLPSLPAVTPEERRRILTEEGFDPDAVADGLRQRNTDLHSRWLPWVWLAMALGIAIAVFPRNLFIPAEIDTRPPIPEPTDVKTAAAREVAALMAAGRNDAALDRCRELLDAIPDGDLDAHAGAADLWHVYLTLLASRGGADEIHDRELLDRVTVFARAAPDDLYAIHYLALMRGRRALMSMAPVDQAVYRREVLESVGMIANARLNIGASKNDLSPADEERWRREFGVDLAHLYERLWALEGYAFHSEQREKAFDELRFSAGRTRRGVALQVELYRKTSEKWPRSYWKLGFAPNGAQYVVNGAARGFADVQKEIKELGKDLAALPPEGAGKP